MGSDGAKDIAAMERTRRLGTPKLALGELYGFCETAEAIHRRDEQSVVRPNEGVSTRGAECNAAASGAYARVDDCQVNGPRREDVNRAPQEKCSRLQILGRNGVRHIDQRH